MLTSLYIKTPQYKSKLKNILSRLMFDSMVVDIKHAQGLTVKQVTYTNRSHNINWSRIDKEVGAQRNRLLCEKNIIFPEKSGYRRFECNEFMHRLCTNTAVALLSCIRSTGVKVGLVDTDASFTGLLQHLLQYTDDMVVVTAETDLYSHVSEEILNNMGAVVRLSRTVLSLSDCDLVIAPKGLEDNIKLKEGTVVLSTAKSIQRQSITMIYDYAIELDEKLSVLCPDYISHTYFASAVYTTSLGYRLGALVPSLCISDTKVHTLSSLKVLMHNIVDKNLT